MIADVETYTDEMPVLREYLDDLHRELNELRKDVNAKHEENIKRFIQLDSHLLYHDSQLHDFKADLFGNGQPGILEKLSNRIHKLEVWMWRSFGFVSAVLAIVSLVSILKK